MNSFKLAFKDNLLDIGGVSGLSGVSKESISRLVTLRIISPVGNDAVHGPLFSAEQVTLLGILDIMTVLNYRLEVMRGMATAVDSLERSPASEGAGKHRTWIGDFAQSLHSAPMSTAKLSRAKNKLLFSLSPRYTWPMV